VAAGQDGLVVVAAVMLLPASAVLALATARSPGCEVQVCGPRPVCDGQSLSYAAWRLGGSLWKMRGDRRDASSGARRA
jgi:hypothetical protein